MRPLLKNSPYFDLADKHFADFFCLENARCHLRLLGDLNATAKVRIPSCAFLSSIFPVIFADIGPETYSSDNLPGILLQIVLQQIISQSGVLFF